MNARSTALLVLLCLTLAGCGPDERPDNRIVPATQPSPTPSPVPTPSPTLKIISVMRPAVADEADAVPEPGPALPLNATVYFDSGKAALTDEMRATLDPVVNAAGTIDGATITIRGSTDSNGEDQDNKRMSLKRAGAVRDYLVAKGLAADRMTLIALGETRPAAPNAALDGSDDPAGRQKNRRVDVVVEQAGATPPPQP